MRLRSSFIGGVDSRAMADITVVLAALMLGGTGPSDAQPVTDADQACAIAKASLARRRNVSESVIAFCDVIPADRGPRGYFITALHSRRQCEGICSTNLGWFAVEESTGRVFAWDVADWTLGPPANQNP